MCRRTRRGTGACRLTAAAPPRACAGSPDSPQRNPLITRIEVRAGHGAGKPTSKILAETSDSLAFAAKACGATWQYKEPSAQS